MNDKTFSAEYQKRNTEATINSLGNVAVTMSGLVERLNLPGFVPEQINDDQKAIIKESLGRISVLYADINSYFQEDYESEQTLVINNISEEEAEPQTAQLPELELSSASTDNALNDINTSQSQEAALIEQDKENQENSDTQEPAAISELMEKYQIKEKSRAAEIIAFIHNSNKSVSIAEICESINFNNYNDRDTKGKTGVRNNVSFMLKEYVEAGLLKKEKESESVKSKPFYSINSGNLGEVQEVKVDDIAGSVDMLINSEYASKFENRTKELLSLISTNLKEALSSETEAEAKDCLDRVRSHFDTILTEHKLPSAGVRSTITDILIEFGKQGSKNRKR
ncbi:hypothetical protein LJC64_03620 [Ruminococcaceae bacterium OttesenSCG-928-A11]|nr:hypothetical protein [Ruminococcaceae bacterium OttesenSCG-928-A11]